MFEHLFHHKKNIGVKRDLIEGYVIRVTIKKCDCGKYLIELRSYDLHARSKTTKIEIEDTNTINKIMNSSNPCELVIKLIETQDVKVKKEITNNKTCKKTEST